MKSRKTEIGRKVLVWCCVLAMAVSLAVGCETGSGGATPTPSPASWQIQDVFGGNTDTTTDPFHIEGEKFRITWKVVPTQAVVDHGTGASITVHVFHEGESTNPVGNFTESDIMAQKSGNTVIHEGPGRFYIDLKAVGTASWELTVEVWG
ncbi:hypothetical protein ACFLXE_03025 [Chloroflexota bacterium]